MVQKQGVWIPKVSMAVAALVLFGACGSGLSYYQEGVQAMSRSDYESAVDSFTSAIEEDDSSDVAYVNRGDAYLGLPTPDLSSARADYSSAIERAKQPNPWFYNRRGLVNFELGDYPAAISDWEMAKGIEEQRASQGLQTRTSQAYEDMLKRRERLLVEAQQLASGATVATAAGVTEIGGEAEAGVTEIGGEAETGVAEIGGEAEAGVVEIGGEAEAGVVEIGGEAEAGVVEVGGEAEAGMAEMGGEAEADVVEIGGEAEAGVIEIDGETESGVVEIGAAAVEVPEPSADEIDAALQAARAAQGDAIAMATAEAEAGVVEIGGEAEAGVVEIGGEAEAGVVEIGGEAEAGMAEMGGEAEAVEIGGEVETGVTEIGGEVGAVEIGGEVETGITEIGAEAEAGAVEIGGEAEGGVVEIGGEGAIETPVVEIPEPTEAEIMDALDAARAEQATAQLRAAEAEAEAVAAAEAAEAAEAVEGGAIDVEGGVVEVTAEGGDALSEIGSGSVVVVGETAAEVGSARMANLTGTWMRDDGYPFSFADDGQKVIGELADRNDYVFYEVKLDWVSDSALEGTAVFKEKLTPCGFEATVRWTLSVDGSNQLTADVQEVGWDQSCQETGRDLAPYSLTRQ